MNQGVDSKVVMRRPIEMLVLFSKRVGLVAEHR